MAGRSARVASRGDCRNEDLARIAAGIRTTVSALAVAWALHVPGVTGANCEARTPAQVDGWLHAGLLSLGDDGLLAIDAAMARAGIPWAARQLA
jgi:aryl-alcohol dehydrogenase-like predicted oxidoreductase